MAPPHGPRAVVDGLAGKPMCCPLNRLAYRQVGRRVRGREGMRGCLGEGFRAPTPFAERLPPLVGCGDAKGKGSAPPPPLRSACRHLWDVLAGTLRRCHCCRHRSGVLASNKYCLLLH